MKPSDQLREKAKRCGTYGMRMSGEISYDETTEWKAADLLEECERALLNWKEAFNTGRNEPLVIAKEVAENTLAKLRAQEKTDE